MITSDRRRTGSILRAGAVVAIAVTISGCGTSQDDAVRARVTHLYSALRASDGGGACADLARAVREELVQRAGGSCAEVILDQDVPPSASIRDIRVYGSMARVRYAGETAFLSRFSDGWRVIAAGCQPTSGDTPHTCAIKVG